MTEPGPPDWTGFQPQPLPGPEGIHGGQNTHVQANSRPSAQDHSHNHAQAFGHAQAHGHHAHAHVHAHAHGHVPLPIPLDEGPEMLVAPRRGLRLRLLLVLLAVLFTSTLVTSILAIAEPSLPSPRLVRHTPLPPPPATRMVVKSQTLSRLFINSFQERVSSKVLPELPPEPAIVYDPAAVILQHLNATAFTGLWYDRNTSTLVLTVVHRRAPSTVPTRSYAGFLERFRLNASTFFSDDLTIPTPVWKLEFNASVEGIVDGVEQSADSVLTYVVYHNIIGSIASRIVMLRIYSVLPLQTVFTPTSEDIDPGEEEDPDYPNQARMCSPEPYCFELPLSGTLAVTAMDFDERRRCFRISRSGDIYSFRTICAKWDKHNEHIVWRTGTYGALHDQRSVMSDVYALHHYKEKDTWKVMSLRIQSNNLLLQTFQPLNASAPKSKAVDWPVVSPASQWDEGHPMAQLLGVGNVGLYPPPGRQVSRQTADRKLAALGYLRGTVVTIDLGKLDTPSHTPASAAPPVAETAAVASVTAEGIVRPPANDSKNATETAPEPGQAAGHSTPTVPTHRRRSTAQQVVKVTEIPVEEPLDDSMLSMLLGLEPERRPVDSRRDPQRLFLHENGKIIGVLLRNRLCILSRGSEWPEGHTPGFFDPFWAEELPYATDHTALFDELEWRPQLDVYPEEDWTAVRTIIDGIFVSHEGSEYVFLVFNQGFVASYNLHRPRLTPGRFALLHRNYKYASGLLVVAITVAVNEYRNRRARPQAPPAPQ
eukprot:TRINITY_DN17443_c0_g1_i1.p1 TRINITY_DN17443_c0_g1~~TRINITY_DN17443_c0_g1_i1.p1  ORF type:complete len:765 (+),score=77.66 TRINITY_DN17443_c0_g1_i1:94-2388(+)